mmetsp:Transcript_24222/g.36322  ORF Transcript_24222/g.36322 Transcript_24222/m.36322 type:complete len:113 (+) Transcript_24222:1051-1389(+)
MITREQTVTTMKELDAVATYTSARLVVNIATTAAIKLRQTFARTCREGFPRRYNGDKRIKAHNKLIIASTKSRAIARPGVRSLTHRLSPSISITFLFLNKKRAIIDHAMTGM